MNVAVTVASERVPAWHAWCIDALRASPHLDVRVVRVEGDAWRSPGGMTSRACGPALAPVRVRIDADHVREDDLVVDLRTPGGVDSRGAARGANDRREIWSFRLGGETDATLPFAGEIAAGSDTFDIALLRRRGERVERLRSGRFPVTKWYASTLRLAFAQAARWPAILAGARASGIAIDVEGVEDAPVERSRRNGSALGLGASGRIRFAAMLAARFARSVPTALFDVVEWNVGFTDGDARVLLDDAPLAVRWLPAPDRSNFIADPFVAERDGVRALFVETIGAHGDRGGIEAIVLDDDDRILRRVRAIDIDTHLSYPYPLEVDGQLYIVPENCAGNEIALYRCVRFPDRWEREVALFPNFDGVDTTLFEHGGRWWALCTRWSQGSALALYAYHAASVRGPWEPHAMNPIVVDVSSARPAGQPFIIDDVLYRPGQDCSRSYGAGLAIARIDELTPTAYRETIVRRHDARTFGRWSDGIHTVSFTRGRVVVDGKRVYRDPRKVPHALRRLRVALAHRFSRRSPAAAKFA